MTNTDQSQEENWRIACAEELGWESFDGGIGRGWYPPNLHPMQNVYGHNLPDPLYSIADAFALVEAVRKDGTRFALDDLVGSWIACFYPVGTSPVSAVGPTAQSVDPDICRAITVAFLKLKGRV